MPEQKKVRVTQIASGLGRKPGQIETLIGYHKLAHLVGVARAARFDDVEDAIAFTVRFHVNQFDPRIHQ